MKRRIVSSFFAIVLLLSVVAFGTSAAAVDLSDYAAADSTVNFHIKEIYSKIDVAEYQELDEVVAYANALKSAAVNGTSVSDISISWNGSEYGLEEFCDEIVFPVIPMGTGARKAADAVMNNSSLWPLGTPVKDISQTVYDASSYTEVYNLWKHLRDDHKDGFLSVAEFISEKSQLEAKIKALKTPSVEPTVPLKVRGENITLQESISLFFAISDVSEYSDVHVEFTVNGETTTNSDMVSLSGVSCFKYANLSAKQGVDEITAVLVGTFNGKEYRSDAYTASVANYCYKRINSTTSAAAFKRVCVDLLNYCSAAQTYFNYKTETLANAKLTDEQKALGSSEYAELTNNRSLDAYTDYGIKAFNLVYEDVIQVQVAVEAADINGLVAKVNFDGMTYTFDTFYEQVIAGKTYYVFDFTQIAPTQQRKTFTVSLEKDGAAIGGTGTFSIESYLALRIANSNTNAIFKELLVATAKYGDSCAAYFG